jgi:hypothetical protein
MTTFQLKLIAVILMVIDHIGYFLFPSNMILRIIGRLSFPLFAFLIAKGYKYTSNPKRFFMRLFIFANIIQLPVLLIPIPVNIFYTLSLGLLMIIVYEMKLDKYIKYTYLFGIVFLTYLINPDYSIYGVFLIFSIHIFMGKWLQLTMAFLLLSLMFYGIHYQIYSVFSILLMMTYNEKLGFKLKWFFYLFYPVHLVILNYISQRMRL